MFNKIKKGIVFAAIAVFILGIVSDIPLYARRAKTVVVTHHAPSIHSIPEIYKTDYLSAAFASNLEDFISSSKIDIWIHGHLHDPSDYKIGETRIVCNPRGYIGETHKGFIPELVIEV